MPTVTDTLRNGMPRTILRSPAHRLLGSVYCLLEFTGRKTGTAYGVPVAYVERDGVLYVSTDSKWWRNLTDDRPFTLRLRGRRRAALARRIEGPAAVDALAELVTIRGYAKAAGIQRVDGRVSREELVRAAAERSVLEVTLAEAS